MRSLGGLLRLAHVAGHARRAGARTSMVPISEPKDLQDRGTIAALKRRRPGHATATVTIISAWLGVGRHRGTAPPGLPSTSAHAQCSEPVADVTLFRRNKSPKIHQPKGFLASKGQLGLILATVHFYDPPFNHHTHPQLFYLW